MKVIDLFAGPGGWDVGALSLGLDPLGVEWDDAACATRRAAGLRTQQADVAALDPLDFAPVRGLIASPPCQAFSMAGKGAGRRALRAYHEAIGAMARGEIPDRAKLDAECDDSRAHLVLEPLRWAMALRPLWIACEQVRPVAPLWDEMRDALRQLGYSAWSGVLTAERYGVPQTRERAILIASLDREVHEPRATHRRYVAPRKLAEGSMSLFDAPDPERIVLPEDRGLRPWVSMAEALGWGNDRVGFPRRADNEHAVEIDGEEYRERDFREASEPAFTVTEKARSAIRLRANARPNACVRGIDEPAPTITGGHDHGDRQWVGDATVQTENFTAVARDPDGRRSRDGSVPYERSVESPSPTVTGNVGSWKVNTGRDWKEGGTREDAQTFDAADRPAPAVDGKGRWHAEEVWPEERPATTVAGDPRVFPPGHKINADDEQAGRGGQQRSGAGHTEDADAARAVRVDIDEAAVLQDFPRGYPWQGTRTAIYRQIGDAIPPGLARAVLIEALGL